MLFDGVLHNYKLQWAFFFFRKMKISASLSDNRCSALLILTTSLQNILSCSHSIAIVHFLLFCVVVPLYNCCRSQIHTEHSSEIILNKSSAGNQDGNWLKNGNQDTFRQQVAFIPWHACNIFDDIDDNNWMPNALYQDIKLEFLPERKVKIRSKSPTLDEWQHKKTYKPKLSTTFESTKDREPGG